jgi:hypothetical protein
MKLGICTIQRDRGRWVEEWLAFHYLVGFRKFYFYAHQCMDDTLEVLLRLQRTFDLQVFTLSADLERPQLGAYQHAYERFGAEVDWMAFIDGDEFLYSPAIMICGGCSNRTSIGICRLSACIGYASAAMDTFKSLRA